MAGPIIQGSRATVRLSPTDVRRLDALKCGDRIPTPRLIEIVWPEKRPARPGPALHERVSVLRAKMAHAGLPGVIHAAWAQGYQLSA